MNKLDNKVAVVTGGNSGIGLATAKLFAKNGAKVAITGRNQQTIDTATKQIGHDAIGFVSDVSEISNIEEQYKNISASLGKIDVLVVNAGILLTAPLAEFTEEQFDQISDVNFKGAFFSVQRALPYLNDGASIVLTATSIIDKGIGITAAYSASKAAVRSLARSFSHELLDRNIRVNVLSPGPVDTPIFGRGGASEEEVAGTKNHFASFTPLNRIGTADEIAEGFLYLASDDSRFMLGGELLLDGGFRNL